MMRETSSTSPMSFAWAWALRSMISRMCVRRSGRNRSPAKHRDPAEDRVERRAELVRKRRQEFVLQPIGALRFVARRVQRDEHVAQLVLPLASAEGRANGADHRRHPDRAVEQRDVAQVVERRQRAQQRLRCGRRRRRGGSGPRTTPAVVRARPTERESNGIVQRFFGQHDSAGAALAARRPARSSSRQISTGDGRARQQVARQDRIAADRREDKYAQVVWHPGAASSVQQGIRRCRRRWERR